QLPGWHTTIFPPYFVAGAIFSGFGMVLTLLIPLRSMFKLEDIITMRHIDIMCKVTMATGSIVAYAYGMEFFIAWYGGNASEQFHFLNRAFGPYNWGWAMMMSCNTLVPQLFWFKKVRQNLIVVFIISILVNIGMWFERFVIIVLSLHRDFLPSSPKSCRIVVSGGRKNSHSGMSSNPTTLTSRGTRIDRSDSARSRPSAIWSFPQNTAVTPGIGASCKPSS